MKIDKIDGKILYELINNSTQTDTNLGSKLGLSSVSIRNRISKLVKTGVIEQFVPHYHAEPFGMDSLYIVASKNNFKELMKQVRVFGKLSHIIHCIGSTVILGIVVRDNFKEKLDFADQLIKEGKAITVSSSQSTGFNKIITKTELKILQALIPNTQISHDELSTLTNLSKKTISRTVRKLRENKILHSTIIWNPRKIENYLTFYIAISVQDDSEKTIGILTKKFSESFLAAPMIFEKEIVLTMYVNNIHEMDEIVEKIKLIKKIKNSDVYIPKKFEFIYDWFNDFVTELETAPLHISLKKKPY